MERFDPSRTGIVGRVLRRGGEGYERLRRGAVWHAGVPDRFPEVIVFASTEDDVGAAVRIARELGLRVAVRSSGHSWWTSILSALSYTDTEAEARGHLAFLDTVPVRSQALATEVLRPTEHGAVELDESTDVLNEDRGWIADNVATSAGFDEMWPGLDHLIQTCRPRRRTSWSSPGTASPEHPDRPVPRPAENSGRRRTGVPRREERRAQIPPRSRHGHRAR